MNIMLQMTPIELKLLDINTYLNYYITSKIRGHSFYSYQFLIRQGFKRGTYYF